ncbi:uncharacterized protein LOC131256656 isoform X2 [Magnolia sinica]|uniref:uncharacterized protein LOC131256656 isoform X2 n=1 Tax=Magnolia sinica TaxID=86752 RepID=UPI002657BE46|nr:uncharacterized protein LOC131256656 isoform X2 [Magnolia sinica]
MLSDWALYGETWHKSSKHDEYPRDDECRKSISTREEKDEVVTNSPLLHYGICSNVSAIEDMCESSSPKKNDFVYKRRRKLENSIAFLLEHAATGSAKGDNAFLSSVSSDSGKASIMPVRVWDRDVLCNVNTSDCQQHNPQNPDNVHSKQIYENLEAVAMLDSVNDCSIGEVKGWTEASAIDDQISALVYCSSTNDSFSSLKSNVEHGFDFIRTEADYATECSSSNIAREALRKCSSKKESHDFTGSCVSPDIVGVHGDAGASLSCKVCYRIENPLKMLICDLCEEAFHLSCCNPRIKRIPVDEWYCQPCLKKKPKPLLGIAGSRKSLNTASEEYRRKSLQSCDPILFMFEDTEPYTTGVRIGKAFQADVPDWSGPISDNSNIFGEPLEIDPAECARLNGWTCNKQKSVGNWIQCREVIDEDGGVICGKWRRAPLFEVQTDDWDCSCSVLWDPIHSDCAVPQELATEEVMGHLKYIELLAGKEQKQTQWF